MSDTLDVCLLAVVRGKQVLLIHRRKPPYRGYWGMPGGKLRRGESVRQAALREGREETGLRLSFDRVCGVATENITDEAGRVEAHFVIFVARLFDAGGEPRPCEEGELAWFARERLGEIRIIPSDRMMLERFVFPDRRVDVIHFEVERTGGVFRLASMQEQCHEPYHA